MGIIVVFLMVGALALIIMGVYSVLPHKERRVEQVDTNHRRRWYDVSEYYAKHSRDAWGDGR